MSELAIGLAIVGATLLGGFAVWGIQRLITFKTTTEEKQLESYEESLDKYKDALEKVTNKLSDLIVNFTSFYSSTMEQAKVWSENTDKINKMQEEISELKEELFKLKKQLAELMITHNHFHNLHHKGE